MNSPRLAVAILLGAVAIAFLLGVYFFQQHARESQEQRAGHQAERLVRVHSPVVLVGMVAKMQGGRRLVVPAIRRRRSPQELDRHKANRKTARQRRTYARCPVRA